MSLKNINKEIRKLTREKRKEKELVIKQTIEYCKKEKYQQVCFNDMDRKEFKRLHTHTQPLWNRVIEFTFSLPARLLFYALKVVKLK